MLRHQDPSGHDREPSRSVPSPLEQLEADPAFTIYLDTVCAPLARLAPEYWVADLRAELAVHLECTAEAYEELGETRAQAVLRACRSLGDPAELGERWKAHWEAKIPEPFRVTYRLAFREFAMATLIGTGMLLLSCANSLNASPRGDNVGDLLRILGVLVMPIVAGYRLASRSRGRRVGGVAAATVSLAAVIAFLGGILPGADPSGLRPFLWQIQLVYWLPLGCAATGITGLIKARRERRRKLSGS